MLVDLRVADTVGALAPRAAHLELPADCTATLVDPGVERRRYASAGVVLGRGRSTTTTVDVTLEAGQGALIHVSGAGCLERFQAARQWWFDPTAISLAHTYPSEQSPKASTYGSYGASQSRYKSPGGLSAGESNYIVGGSWANGPGSDTDTKAIADAGFLLISAPRANLTETLGWAAAYGVFVASIADHQASPADVALTATAFGCHTNFFGFVLDGTRDPAAPPNCTSALAWAVAQGGALRQAAHWQIPVVLGATVPECAAAAAEGGLPFAPMATDLAAVPGGATPTAIATAALAAFAGLQSAAKATAMTAAVALSACDTDSDSILRFAAYSSLVVGAQALWWDGMDRCAPVGSPKFALIGAINSRIALWGNVFVHGPGGDGVAPLRVFSTSTVTVPNASAPGGSIDDLVQGMPPELILFELSGPGVAVPGGKKVTRLLYVVSTELSSEAGGAAPRQVTLELRADVRGTQPIEGNCFQGHCLCNLMRVGNVLPLTLSGGSAQLVGYFLVADEE